MDDDSLLVSLGVIRVALRDWLDAREDLPLLTGELTEDELHAEAQILHAALRKAVSP